jgi:ATP-dependent exoDNAse (exonuclease V) alpha subunit
MASYHFHLAHVSRGAGQSAVAAAAYRAGECLRDDYYGEVHDFTKKGGVIMSEIILPDNAPERFTNREMLWNEVEEIEKNKRAQLAYSFDFTLQNELSMEENIEVAEKFIRENFTARGMICDVAIHSPGRGPDDNPNPHVHVLVPMRPLNENGTWGAKQRREYILDENGNRIRGEDGKYLFAYHHVFLAGLLLSTAVTL